MVPSGGNPLPLSLALHNLIQYASYKIENFEISSTYAELGVSNTLRLIQDTNCATIVLNMYTNIPLGGMSSHWLH